MNISFYGRCEMKKFLSFVLPILLIADAVIFTILHNSGTIWFDVLFSGEQPVLSVDVSKYTVRGVDVSEYQGNIDWNVLAEQNISFAYIKATKGSKYRDKKFSYNWENASKTKLKIGAYHLFDYEDPASEQAANYISVVPKQEESLPPAIDLELYGEQRENPPDREKTVGILSELLSILEDHYGKKPVIYVTKRSFNLYIKGNFKEYPLWARNVHEEPQFPDNREWTFWQYSNRGVLKGYEGEETFIDLNVFNGTREDLERRFS